MTTTTATTLADGTWTVRPDAVATFTVRKLGLIRVHGGFTVAGGTVTVAGGRPVAATATLDAASVRTGIAKRDADLAGRRFFRTAKHPEIRVHCLTIDPDGDDWRAEAVLAVAGGEAPVTLRVTRLPDTGPGTVRIRITGMLDRAATPIGAPRWLIGRWVGIQVGAALRFSGR